MHPPLKNTADRSEDREQNTTTVSDRRVLIETLKGQKTQRVPIWLMRQAGRYLPEYRRLRQQKSSFLDFCYTPDLATEATLQPLARFDLDAAILFSDILVIPDALGQPVTFVEGMGPVLKPVRTRGDVESLSAAGAVDHLAPVLQTVANVSASLDPAIALIGFAGAPWTVAVYMVEGRGGTDCGTLKRWAFEDPDGLEVLIDRIVEATIDYLIAQIYAGAHAVQLFDSWAGVLSDTFFHRWVIAPTRRIVDRIAETFPGFPVIGFPRYAGTLIPDFVAGTGVSAVSLDHTVSLDWAKHQIQPMVTTQGNLDNHLLVVGGPALEAGVARILEVLGDGPHVFNLGHGVLPVTDPENVSHAIACVRRYEQGRR